MRRLDELHLQWPFLGSRMLREHQRGYMPPAHDDALQAQNIPSADALSSELAWRRRIPS